jgi:hypothetical protein
VWFCRRSVRRRLLAAAKTAQRRVAVLLGAVFELPGLAIMQLHSIRDLSIGRLKGDRAGDEELNFRS